MEAASAAGTSPLTSGREKFWASWGNRVPARRPFSTVFPEGWSLRPGSVWYAASQTGPVDIYRIPEPARRLLMRTDWGIVHQNSTESLRMRVSAGGNVGSG